LCDVW